MQRSAPASCDQFLAAFPGVIWRILGLALAHLAASVLTAFLTFGLDLDRLRSRSPLSRAAGVLYDVLWFPHDSLVRALPPGWLHAGWAAPVAVLLGTSVLWGVALLGAWQLVARAWRDAFR